MKLAMINLKADNAVRLIQEINEKIDKVRKEMDACKIIDAQGVILHSKARWFSQSEVNTKYFFSLEKRNAKAKNITATVDKNGLVPRNPGKVLKLQAEYFEKLYTAKEGFECKIEGKLESSLEEGKKEELEKEITMEEIQDAVKSMAKKKSPGLSGFSMDFYVVFWQKIKQIFYEVVLGLVYLQGKYFAWVST